MESASRLKRPIVSEKLLPLSTPPWRTILAASLILSPSLINVITAPRSNLTVRVTPPSAPIDESSTIPSEAMKSPVKVLLPARMIIPGPVLVRLRPGESSPIALAIVVLPLLLTVSVRLPPVIVHAPASNLNAPEPAIVVFPPTNTGLLKVRAVTLSDRIVPPFNASVPVPAAPSFPIDSVPALNVNPPTKAVGPR